MIRESVESTNVAAIGYDPATRELEVQFRPTRKGEANVYVYEDVDPQEHYELVTAESVGKQLQVIKAAHRVRKIGVIGIDGVETPIVDGAA